MSDEKLSSGAEKNTSEVSEAHTISIANKDKILGEIDQVIFNLNSTEHEKTAKPSPPAVEYLFVEPFGSFRIWGSFGFGLNPYGQYVFQFYFKVQNKTLIFINPTILYAIKND